MFMKLKRKISNMPLSLRKLEQKWQKGSERELSPLGEENGKRNIL